MFRNYKYTDKEIKQILNSLSLLIDTREKSNSHIISWLDKKKINYKSKKLDQGDYSFYIPKNKELNIDRDLYFNNELSIERKGSLDELAGNFSNNRDRIEKEFALHEGNMILIVEDSSYRDIYKGNYRSKYSSKSYLGTLHSFSNRYNIPFMFIDKECSAMFIYFTFRYYLRDLLKN